MPVKAVSRDRSPAESNGLEAKPTPPPWVVPPHSRRFCATPAKIAVRYACANPSALSQPHCAAERRAQLSPPTPRYFWTHAHTSRSRLTVFRWVWKQVFFYYRLPSDFLLHHTCLPQKRRSDHTLRLINVRLHFCHD